MRGWLRETREARGYTAQEMADLLHISLSFYSMIESGSRLKRMDIPMAGKLADVLEMPLSEVIKHEMD